MDKVQVLCVPLPFQIALLQDNSNTAMGSAVVRAFRSKHRLTAHLTLHPYTPPPPQRLHPISHSLINQTFQTDKAQKPSKSHHGVRKSAVRSRRGLCGAVREQCRAVWCDCGVSVRCGGGGRRRGGAGGGGAGGGGAGGGGGEGREGGSGGRERGMQTAKQETRAVM